VTGIASADSSHLSDVMIVETYLIRQDYYISGAYI